jgi:hypothetical protein
LVVEAVEAMDLPQVKVNTRGTGDEPYPPSLMLGWLSYSDATGTFGSRRLERSTFDNVAVRFIAADPPPDHDPLCPFRREKRARLSERFVKGLQLAQQLKVLPVGPITVSVEGSKVLANASKPAAARYERAGKLLAPWELAVKPLMEKAEPAEATPLQEGLSIPQEITRRQERKAALAQARAQIEARAAARYAAELAAHDKKMAERPARQARGQRVGGQPPAPPRPPPGPSEQPQFTDPASRILKAGSGQHFEQRFNAQAAVAVDSRRLVGPRVSPAPNDKQARVPTVNAMPAEVGPIGAGLTDHGFFSENAVSQLEQTLTGEPSGPRVDAPLDQTRHPRTVADWEPQAEPEPPPAGASVSEVRRHRLKTGSGKALCQLRQQTVAPGFGILKSALGFREFLLRGVAKVSVEWEGVCLAYNVRRLHPLGAGLKLAALR